MRPIIFSGPMVMAILEGRKTQTRRVIKPQPTGTEPTYNPSHFLPDRGWYFKGCGVSKPRYQPGDILWVRETWCKNENPKSNNFNGYEYRAEYEGAMCQDLITWKPSTFMPKAAARIFLRVTGVRVERLQEISGEDCMKEGTAKLMSDLDDELCDNCPLPEEMQGVRGTPNGYSSCEGSRCQEAYEAYLEEPAIDEFADIWDSINGKKYPWANNPWVWVIEFEREGE